VVKSKYGHKVAQQLRDLWLLQSSERLPLGPESRDHLGRVETALQNPDHDRPLHLQQECTGPFHHLRGAALRLIE
jgi:hypothetical protein